MPEKKPERNKLFYKIAFLLLFSGGVLLRFYNLDWDQGHYLHPDERLYVNASNLHLPASVGEFFSPDSPLNPNMFYYGSFPLYLYKATSYLLPWLNFLLISRSISALLSFLTIPVIYLIGKSIFGRKAGLAAAVIFAFAPGSIQHAHFNTTESLLVFLLSLILFLSIKLKAQKKWWLFLPLGILVGLAYATKIVGLTFALLPFISFVHLFLKNKRERFKLFILGLLFTILMLVFGAGLTPYQIIDFDQFQREQSYMQGVTYGKFKPPFVIIYEYTLPYIYPLVKVFPFSLGFFALPLSLIGLIWFILKSKKAKRDYFLIALLFIWPSLYFAWAGAWYVKFARYFMLLFPVLGLTGGYFLSKTKRFVFFGALALIAINGCLTVRLYLENHNRIAASEWIYGNIPFGKTLAGEHWGDNLPLPHQNLNTNLYNMISLEVYNLPDDASKSSKISQLLNSTDYLILSSRRVYYSILRNPEKYPLTSQFYRDLLAGRSQFRLVKTFTNYPFGFPDDFADESFQSYDHPPVLIFKNVSHE